MSDRPTEREDRSIRSIQPMASDPRSEVTASSRVATQGMIGPLQFVQPSGDLTAVSFRFLNSLFQAVGQLQAQAAALHGTVQALQANVQALQVRPPPAEEIPH